MGKALDPRLATFVGATARALFWRTQPTLGGGAASWGPANTSSSSPEPPPDLPSCTTLPPHAPPYMTPRPEEPRSSFCPLDFVQDKPLHLTTIRGSLEKAPGRDRRNGRRRRRLPKPVGWGLPPVLQEVPVGGRAPLFAEG